MVKHAADDVAPLLTAEEAGWRALDKLSAGRKFNSGAGVESYAQGALDG